VRQSETKGVGAQKKSDIIQVQEQKYLVLHCGEVVEE
jgi:predicted nucleic-acid-binding Zn-ribbon protein